jgi:hypothetical protein
MKTSINELASLNREDALQRTIERIADRAVLDMKFDRALQVMRLGLAAHQVQLSYDEMDATMTHLFFM